MTERSSKRTTTLTAWTPQTEHTLLWPSQQLTCERRNTPLSVFSIQFMQRARWAYLPSAGSGFPLDLWFSGFLRKRPIATIQYRADGPKHSTYWDSSGTLGASLRFETSQLASHLVFIYLHYSYQGQLNKSRCVFQKFTSCCGIFPCLKATVTRSL